MTEVSTEDAPTTSALAGDAPAPVRGPALRAEAMRGVRNLGAATYGARAISVVSLVIVARYLSPRETGIGALALLIGSTLSALSDFGLSPTIVSLGGRASAATFHRAARLRLIASGTGFAAVFFGADFIAAALSAPEAAMGLRVVAFVLPIGAAGFAPATGLAASRNFGGLARAYIGMSAVQATFTIVFAVTLGSYWAIVFGLVGGMAAQVCLQWLFWRHRPAPGTVALSNRDLLSIAVVLVLSWGALLALFTADRLVVTGWLGPAALGYYALAFTWGTFASDSFNLVVGTVALPTFAALGDDTSAMGRTYLTSMRLIVFVAAPASLGLIVIAPELLQVVLSGGTGKWLPSLLALQIFAIVGLLKSIVGSSNSVLLASQSIRRYAYLVPVPLAAFLAALWPAFRLLPTIEGVALALLLAYAINAVLVLRAMTRVFNFARMEIVRNIARPIGAAGFMVLVMLPMRTVLEPTLVSLVLFLAVGGAAYLVGFLVLRSKSTLDEFRAALRAVIGAKGGRA